MLILVLSADISFIDFDDTHQGALWTRVMLEKACYRGKLPEFRRVVVGVDPSGTSGDDHGNRVGIVAVGLGIDGICYVVADRSCSLGPDGWGRRVVDALDSFNGDRIVVERNFGGAMAEHVMHVTMGRFQWWYVSCTGYAIWNVDGYGLWWDVSGNRHVLASNATCEWNLLAEHATSPCRCARSRGLLVILQPGIILLPAVF